jgi:ubiquitin-conjugating enzyme E2 G1
LVKFYLKFIKSKTNSNLRIFCSLDIQKADDLNASIGLENDDDLFLWNIVFEGPEDSLYEGGYFKAQLKFPEDYPNNPPLMTFKTKMWHPNIHTDGKVCISILHPPGVDSMNA